MQECFSPTKITLPILQYQDNASHGYVTNVHALTFWQQQLMSHLLTPARWLDVPGVGVDPEVIALWVAIEVQPYPVALDLMRGQGLLTVSLCGALVGLND